MRVRSAGVYRVEVRIHGEAVPWVISNPIYVFDEADARPPGRDGRESPSAAASGGGSAYRYL